MSNSKSNTKDTEVENTEVDTNPSETDGSLDKAIEMYKKIYEKEEMSEKEQKKINENCEIIKARHIIIQAPYHEPV